MALKNWADIWGNIWGDIWATDAAISDGDEVQCVITGGINCTVHHHTGTLVRVVPESAKKVHVIIEGGTPIKVTI